MTAPNATPATRRFTVRSDYAGRCEERLVDAHDARTAAQRASRAYYADMSLTLDGGGQDIHGTYLRFRAQAYNAKVWLRVYDPRT
jgi:hypothetical protein